MLQDEQLLVVQITFEAPPGVRRNLLRSFEGWKEPLVDSGSPLKGQLLFLLAWFHAVVQERRCFIPQGWQKFYEFSFSDLRSGADVVQQATRNGKTPQWSYLCGLLEDAIYGGRVDSSYDMRVRA